MHPEYDLRGRYARQPRSPLRAGHQCCRARTGCRSSNFRTLKRVTNSACARSRRLSGSKIWSPWPGSLGRELIKFAKQMSAATQRASRPRRARRKRQRRCLQGQRRKVSRAGDELKVIAADMSGDLRPRSQLPAIASDLTPKEIRSSQPRKLGLPAREPCALPSRRPASRRCTAQTSLSTPSCRFVRRTIL